MKELTVSELFGLIALKNQRSRQLTEAKRPALRATVAASLLELYIEEKLNKAQVATLLKDKDASASYLKEVLALLPKSILGSDDILKNSLEYISKLNKNKLGQIEGLLVKHLYQNGLLTEENSLLTCDLEFKTAGIEIKEYVVNDLAYNPNIEAFRREVLKEDEISKQAIVLLWLCKESASIYEIFSDQEMEYVAEKYNDLAERNQLANALYLKTIYRPKEHIIKRFLKLKSDAIMTEPGTGVNFIFPYLERSQAVFIDTEKYFPDSKERLNEIIKRLKKYRIDYEIIRQGKVPIFKISGILYEAVPFSKVYRMPVHGIQFRKYPESIS